MKTFVLITQGSCAADLYRHPQLDADIEAVKDIYTDSAISVRYCKSTEWQKKRCSIYCNVGIYSELILMNWQIISYYKSKVNIPIINILS